MSLAPLIVWYSFRTPGTGLYDNLQRFNLPQPEAVFEINYFRDNPDAFFQLAKELYPGNFTPSVTHQFINFLAKKGLLLRHYTQNIDCLDRYVTPYFCDLTVL